jgi:hypothetical protein
MVFYNEQRTESLILPLRHHNTFVSSNAHSECFPIAFGFSSIVRDLTPVFFRLYPTSVDSSFTILIVDIEVAQQYRKLSFHISRIADSPVGLNQTT